MSMARKRRSMLGITSVVTFSALLALWQFDHFSRLSDTSLLTGYLLIGMVAVLALLNVRKRFSFLPLGTVEGWLQVHIYMGCMVVVLFFMHLGLHWPSGLIEIVLAVLFLCVALSGIVGLILSRVIPSRLTARGGNVDFEQIPELRRKIKTRAEKIAVESIQLTGKSTIADFYIDCLESFFTVSNYFFSNHVLASKHHIDPLHTRIHALRRYLNDEENEIIEQLELLLIEKDMLDFQHCWQWVLRVWLFLHIPLSSGLLVLGSFHGLLAFQFLGS